MSKKAMKLLPEKTPDALWGLWCTSDFSTGHWMPLEYDGSLMAFTSLDAANKAVETIRKWRYGFECIPKPLK